MADAWKDRRDEVQKHSGEITEALQQLAKGSSTSGSESSVPQAEVVNDACERLLEVLDTQWGGFGAAPKFPHATDLDLLLRIGSTNHHVEMIDAVELTLDRMAAGGIRDHIG